MASYTQTGISPTPMDDEQSASRMMEEEVAAEPEAKTGWVVDNISIKQAKNGGWIVSCSKHEQTRPNAKNPGRYESNDYTFGSLAEAVPFIESEFGSSAEGGGSMPAPASPIRAGI